MNDPKAAAVVRARQQVSDLINHAMAAAGSAEAVGTRLSELGYEGRDGVYGGRTVRTWRAGARMPPADLLLALVREFGYPPIEGEARFRPRHWRHKRAAEVMSNVS